MTPITVCPYCGAPMRRITYEPLFEGGTIIEQDDCLDKSCVWWKQTLEVGTHAAIMQNPVRYAEYVSVWQERIGRAS